MSTARREETVLSTAPWRGVRTSPLLTRDNAPSTGRHLDWLRCAESLSDDDCDAIITSSRDFPTVPPITVGEEVRPGRRQCEVRKVGVNGQTQWVFDLLGEVAAEATRAAYGLDLTAINRAPQYVEYQPGWGQFDWHNDYSHGFADAPRKLTIIIQLSAATDYEGGRLQLFERENEELPTTRGVILLFPSWVCHRVTPVTRGVRRALVAWVGGPRIR